MIYGSVCSGIEAASVAWKPLGWKCAFVSEIEDFPNAVLKHHYPEVPNYGDVTKFKSWPAGTVDLLVGGTPCQSFSIAGLRKGMADPRGNLALVFLAVARRLRARWIIWENVPGVLSSADGRDFGSFLGGLGQLGYGWAYRVLDAQYFGIPQRRRRVFVVGHLGDWRRAAAVLLERESLSGNPPPGRETGERVAPGVTAGPPFSRTGNERVEADALIAKPIGSHGGSGYRQDPDNETYAPGVASAWWDGREVAETLGASSHSQSMPDKGHFQAVIVPPLKADGFDASEDGTGRGTPLIAGTLGRDHGNVRADQAWTDRLVAFSSKDHGGDAGPTSPTLRASGHDKSHQNAGAPPAIAFTRNQAGDVLSGPNCASMGTNQNATGRNTPKVLSLKTDVTPKWGETGFTLTQPSPSGGGQPSAVMQGMSVRRLTPRECERLQGFPDDYTLITIRGKPAADGPRYKALGNSMAVPVMAWIGRRIQEVEDTIKK